MPQISFFLGIIIRMYFDDHNPSHFHASYAEQQAIIDIKKLELWTASRKYCFAGTPKLI